MAQSPRVSIDDVFPTRATPLGQTPFLPLSDEASVDFLVSPKGVQNLSQPDPFANTF